MENKKTVLKRFGDLEVGDKLIGSDGNETEVNAVYEKHKPKRMFEIEMEDGSITKASGNHLWYTETDLDMDFKEEYERLAKVYFENKSIPNKLDEDGHFPLPILIQLFENDINTQLFVEKAARGLGYSSYTPVISQEMMKNGVPVDTNREIVYNYSFNDLIDFLHKMKLALNNQGYFFFGEVRTSEEIFDLMNKGVSVSIPTRQEIKQVESR